MEVTESIADAVFGVAAILSFEAQIQYSLLASLLAIL